MTNDEIYGKKTFVGLSKNSNSKEKKKLKNRKASAKLFALRANKISSLKNIQLLPKLLVAVNYDIFLVFLKHHLVSFVLNGRRYWSVQSQSLRLPDKSNCAIFSILYADCIII